MDLKEVRNQVRELEPPKAEAKPKNEKTEIVALPALATKSSEQFAYRGYRIFHSLLTGHWWIESGYGGMQGWAVDKADAQNIVDWLIKQAND